MRKMRKISSKRVSVFG